MSWDAAALSLNLLGFICLKILVPFWQGGNEASFAQSQTDLVSNAEKEAFISSLLRPPLLTIAETAGSPGWWSVLHRRAATQNLGVCLPCPSEFVVLTNSERLPVIGSWALRDYKESGDGVIEGKQVGRGVWLEELRKAHLLASGIKPDCSERECHRQRERQGTD